VPLRMMIMRWR